MKGKSFSRREFLRISAIATAGLVLSKCVPKATSEATQPSTEIPAEKPTTAPTSTEIPAEKPTTAPTSTIIPTSTPPPIKEVVLDVKTIDPEYLNGERQIWDLFEADNPGIKINLFAINEPEVPAYQAKVAGGYCAAIDLNYHLAGLANKDTYQQYVNLSEIGFPWFDRWENDVEHAWSNQFGLPGPRTLDIYLGWVASWVYHADLMEKAGLDPRRDVKTWEDLKNFFTEGTKWAKSKDSGVNYFWDKGWLTAWTGQVDQEMFSMQYANGQFQDQIDTFMGKKAINGPDSPWRYAIEFIKEAYDKGWLPESFWTRELEADMEAVYIAKKSVIIMHGPWIWDKALAADPTVQQLGFPSTPPAEGNPQWTQWAAQPDIANGYCIPACNQGSPKWEQIKTAFFWWFSPKVVKMRAENQGRAVLYKLDEPLKLKGAQWEGFAKEVGTPDGLWPNCKMETKQEARGVALPYLNSGYKDLDVFEVNNGVITVLYKDLLTGKKTVQDILDIYQANWEKMYTIPK